MEASLFYTMSSACLPRVKYIDKVSVEPPHVHIRRKTEEFILYYVLSGEMHLKEGNRQYRLQANDLLILDPNLEHYGTRATACTYFYIHFYHTRMKECSESHDRLKNALIEHRLESLKSHECDKNEDNTEEIILPKYFHFSTTSPAVKLLGNLHKLRESHHHRLEYSQLITSGIFFEILITLSRELTSALLYSDTSASTAQTTRKIHELLSFFQTSYAADISGKSIEEQYDCNFDYLNRMFKKATGTTIFAYLSELRISKAKQLLSEGTGNISEVAEKTGFRDVYYFSKVFKKHTGVTPGAFSRKNSSPH